MSMKLNSILAILCIHSVSSFSPSRRNIMPKLRPLRLDVNNGPFDGLYSMIKARYQCPPQICAEQVMVQFVKDLHLPEPFLHWFHAVSMITVLFVMGSYGVYQGYLIKEGRNAKSFDESYKSAVSSHPNVMALMSTFFFIGSAGGLGSLILLDKPILESSHATTALIVLLMLPFQAFLSFAMNAFTQIRPLHVYFGVATMSALFIHFVTGMQLALSF
eukprot:gene12000-25145_t